MRLISAPDFSILVKTGPKVTSKDIIRDALNIGPYWYVGSSPILLGLWIVTWADIALKFTLGRSLISEFLISNARVDSFLAVPIMIAFWAIGIGLCAWQLPRIKNNLKNNSSFIKTYRLTAYPLFEMIAITFGMIFAVMGLFSEYAKGEYGFVFVTVVNLAFANIISTIARWHAGDSAIAKYIELKIRKSAIPVQDS